MRKLLTPVSLLFILLIILAFFLRFYLLPQNLFFGPEQGIDFLAIQNIAIHHKLTLIGAKTDINGIFHGPIYYYLAVIPFILSNGNPLFIASFFIVIMCLTSLLIYYLGKELFNKRVGIISAVIYTFSYGIIEYSRWLSSHQWSITFACLFFIFIVKFIKGNKYSLIFAALSYALLGQAEFLNYFFYAVIILAIVIFYRKNFQKQRKIYLLLVFLFLVFVSTSNYILFDIRHQFLISKSIINLLVGHSGYHVNIIQSLKISITVFLEAYSDFVTPSFIAAGLLSFIITMIILIRDSVSHHKNSFLIVIWILTPVIILILLRHDVLYQFYVSTAAGVIIGIAYMIDTIWRKKPFLAIFFLVLILGIQVKAWIQNIPQNKNIFFQSTQPDLRFSDEKSVIDKIYSRQNGKPFSYQAFTIPYWEQQGWDYLFWQYGFQKYGYLPVQSNAKTLYVIIQDDPNNRQFQKDWLKNTVSTWGRKTTSFKKGILTVEVLKTK